MLNKIKPLFTKVLQNLAAWVGKLGFSPNSLTVTGLILSSLTALLIVERMFLLSAIAFAFGAVLDALDGALARLRHTESQFGAVLDSVADRYSDALVIGALWFALRIPSSIGFFALSGSLITSYTRARFEAAGSGSLNMIGLLERPERLILLFVTIVFPISGVYIFAIIALLSNFTVIQRMVAGRKKLEALTRRSP